MKGWKIIVTKWTTEIAILALKIIENRILD